MISNILYKEKLEYEYITLGLSIRKIASKYDCASTTISTLLRKYNIPTRSNSDYFINLTDQKFGELTIIGLDTNKKSKRKRKYWICKCSCGNITSICSDYLLNSGVERCNKCCNVFNNNNNWQGTRYIGLGYFNAIKHSAKKRGHSFNITIEYVDKLLIEQNFKCIYSGLELAIVSRNSKCDASLDRIDSKIGYEIGNVQWVHKIVNDMKGRLPHEEFIRFCKLVAKNYE